MSACLEAGAEEVDKILDIFVGEAWELDTGLSHRSDLDRNSYNHMARYMAPEQVAQSLRARYGTLLDEPQFHHGKASRCPFASRASSCMCTAKYSLSWGSKLRCKRRLMAGGS